MQAKGQQQIRRTPKGGQFVIASSLPNPPSIFNESISKYHNFVCDKLNNEIEKSNYQQILKLCISPYSKFYFFKYIEWDAQKDFQKLITATQKEELIIYNIQEVISALEDAYEQKILPIFRYAIIEQLKTFDEKKELTFAYPCAEDLFLKYDLFAMELISRLDDFWFRAFCNLYQNNLNYCLSIIWEKFLAKIGLFHSRNLKATLLKGIVKNKPEALKDFDSIDIPSVLDALFYTCQLPYDPCIYLNYLLPSFKASEGLKKSIENIIAELNVKEIQTKKINQLKAILTKHLERVNQEIEELKREQQVEEQKVIDEQMRKEKMMQMKQPKQTRLPITKEKLDKKFGSEKESTKSSIFIEKELTSQEIKEIKEIKGGALSKKGSHSALHTDQGVIMFHQTHGRDTKKGKSAKFTIRTVEKHDDSKEEK